ncbi:GGDEF domain-containing protein [Amycolatopsis thermophila]|uniref:Diguanylate cyclase (GGDEF)-like protein n=1 Tax=Amycolatopsis thermophila TaxID=206084 RepID=A0ABU0ETD6_9PSEU|nr:GGDEF domain-containing protein [Amycolatopsis thermophila]MDQ0378353.1 diguanylate cyclase (GGDEF)-like protein [Amycolatopsis thermophila]
MTEVERVTSERARPDETDLLSLHEDIAELHASQGDFRTAYEHLRTALGIARTARPTVPEQFRREFDRLRRERAEAREDSLRDALTAVYNRRYLDNRLADLLGDARTPLAVALIDIDLFKRVNDTFGHLVGDQVLRRVAELLREGVPAPGFCARYGGEEFMLVLPEVQPGTALRIAEHARSRVAQHPWSEICPGLGVTISVGVSHEPVSGPEQLRMADDLLYAAKHAGRNRVAYRERGGVRVLEHSR